ncbi:hypothetical protein [Blastococcus xanthinilyticus]|uniref:hypothetical protein n=1 Tax=Blastococcus xanthinilyticus TaxID=1564164 RepID=UPI001AA156AB|nr:hypothetical protein [Blastococcus xanthinilyticus]
MLRTALVLLALVALVGPGLPASAATADTLSAGQQLTAGQGLRSASGAYSLTVQGDGNAVLYASGGRPVWNSDTWRSPGSRLVMQTDGNLVLYNRAGASIWHSATWGHAGARVVLHDDGNLVLYRSDGRVLWSTGPDVAPGSGSLGYTLGSGRVLVAGQSLRSGAASYTLAMQSDGNLVTYASDMRPAWNTGTWWSPGAKLVMQTDGNLVLYSASGAPLWHSGTWGNPYARAVLYEDGQVVLQRPDGRAFWSTGADRAGLPMAVSTGNARQLVTVTVPHAGATSGRLTAWEKRGTGWVAVLGPVTAQVGASGIGTAREGVSRTPAGTFSLTESFGRLANPGTALPYRVIDGSDWWVSDVNSSLYNQYARCAPRTCPFNEAAGEHLYAQGWAYNHAVVIDYNRGGTRGAGSAFFLHMSNGQPTAGCVAIEGDPLAALMRWLDPAAAPLISIGVG